MYINANIAIQFCTVFGCRVFVILFPSQHVKMCQHVDDKVLFVWKYVLVFKQPTAKEHLYMSRCLNGL